MLRPLNRMLHPVAVAGGLASVLALTWLNVSIGWRVALSVFYCAGMLMTVVALRRVLRELESALEREHEIARLDPLTGLFNGRAFRDAVAAELARLGRHGGELSLAYLDADGFKQVNDTFGHAEGDHVLRVVAETLVDVMRRTDTIGRIGGDEFVVLLPEANTGDAQTALLKAHSELAAAMARHRWRVTFSIGAITVDTDAITVDEVINRADRLMLQVKRGGKNGLAVSDGATREQSGLFD